MQTDPAKSEEVVVDHPILQGARKVKLLLIFLIGTVTACNQSTLYDQGKELSDQNWHKDSVMIFSPVIEDTSDVMNLGFSFEHTNDYPYSNLWLFVEVENPQGQAQTDTMEFFLAEPDGEWLGKGNDNSRTINWLYKGGVKLAQPGEYTFTLQQGMRRDELKGVNSVSFWIEKAKLRE